MSSPPKRARKQRPSQWRELKRQLFTRPTSSLAQSIANGLVLKDEALFMITEHDGLIPLEGAHGFGAYYHDCRFLDGYTLELDGSALELLGSNPRSGHEAIFELTNPELRMPEGGTVQKYDLGLRLERAVDGEAIAFEDEISVANYSRHHLELDLGLTFRIGFEDVYEVRGICAGIRGELRAPVWQDDELCLSYRGQDDLVRTTAIRFSRRPDASEGTSAHFALRLPPGGSDSVVVEIAFSE